MLDAGASEDSTRGLIESVSSIRGQLLTVRSLLESTTDNTEAVSLLRVVELDTARLTIDLGRVARGRNPLEVTTTEGS